MREQLKRLGDVHDFTVASDEPDVRGWAVRTRDGQEIGQVTELIVDTDARKVRYLEVALDRRGFDLRDEKHVSIPVESAQLNRGGRTVEVSGLSRDAIAAMPESEYGAGRPSVAPGGAAGAAAAGSTAAAAGRTRQDERAIPRTEEELRVGRRESEVGEVIVGKHTETEHVHERVPVERERVRVERRPVEGEARADARFENDEVRIPVVEEEIVTEKRPVVKEELVVGKERVQDVQDVEADLRKERFDVRKTGNVTEEPDRSKPRRGGY